MLTPVPPAARDIATLEEALSLVKARSTDLRIQYLEITRAEAATRVALAQLLTTVTGNVTATQNIIRQTSSGPGPVFIPLGGLGLPLPPSIPSDTVVAGASPSNPVSTTQPVANLATGSITLTQPIFHPADIHAWGTAQEMERIQRLNLEDLERNIALNVANTLVGVVTAERVAELNRIGFRNALERLDLSRRKQRLGAATGLDVVRAQQDVESARATLVTGDESLRQAREALGLSLGLPQQVGVSKALNIDGLEQAALRACKPTKSIEDRADIQALKQAEYVAKRNHDNVWLQFSPVLDAKSTLATTTAAVSPSPPTTWNIQAVLTVPIWEGGVRYGKLHDTEAQAEEAAQRLEAQRRTATVQVVQALRNVKVADDARKVAADARALAAETDRLVRAGYTEGQGTSLELVVAAAALREAEVQLALKEFNVVQARVLAVLSLAKCPF
jgi:outer membrane protein TolC